MNGFTMLIAGCAFLLHLGLVAGIIFGTGNSEGLLFSWMLKAASEFVFLQSLAGFFKKRKLLWYFIPAQILYPFYIVITGIRALKGTYVWKGRQYVVIAAGGHSKSDTRRGDRVVAFALPD